MLKSRISTSRSTVVCTYGRQVTLAPVACPHCAYQVRAADAELQDDGDLRIVCGGCHVDILVVEKP
jgi:hypothetical protein